MLFEPYKDELEYIERIHKYNEKEYTIIRLTDTMLKKISLMQMCLFKIS